jgi:hypothetical protein
MQGRVVGKRSQGAFPHDIRFVGLRQGSSPDWEVGCDQRRPRTGETLLGVGYRVDYGLEASLTVALGPQAREKGSRTE